MPFLVDFVSVVLSFYGVLHFSFFVLQWILQMGFLAAYICLILGTSVYYRLSWEIGLASLFPQGVSMENQGTKLSFALARAVNENMPEETSLDLVVYNSARHLSGFLS